MTGSQIYDLVFNPNTNSANSYFKDLCGEAGDVILPAAVNNSLAIAPGVMEVTMKSAHTNPQNNSDRDALLEAAIKAACVADPSLFSGYPLHNYTLEAKTLSIGFIVDGYESSVVAFSPGIWGGSTSATPASQYTNGVKIESYFALGAFRDSTNEYVVPVGILCHELGHSAFEFIDTYDFGTLQGGANPSSGNGYWSLMSYGCWGHKAYENPGDTPGYADAFNMVASGIVTPGILSVGNNVTLTSHLDIYVAETANNHQYFLVQQRRFGSTDNYDRGVFNIMYKLSTPNNGGMLVYHIDEDAGILGYANEKRTHYRVGIEEAHGGLQNMQQLRGTPFYNDGDLGDLWGANMFEFSHVSDPMSGLYSPYTHNTVPPTQLTRSGIAILGITWSSATGTTSFTMDSGVRTVTGNVWPIITNDLGIPSFLNMHAITVELRDTYLAPAAQGLSTKAVILNPSLQIGGFAIEDVPFGEYVLVIKRPGYLERTMKVTISSVADDDNDNIIILQPPRSRSDRMYNGQRVYDLWWGDCNGDYIVDNGDIQLILGLMSIGVNVYNPLYNPACDMNADGRPDNDDIFLVLEKWGKNFLQYAGSR